MALDAERVGESWASANRRGACLVCGASGGTTILMPDGRYVRACEECLRSDHCREWRQGTTVAVCATCGKPQVGAPWCRCADVGVTP